jgi:acetamidase/formamidase
VLAQDGSTIKYQATIQNVKYVYSSSNPVARLKSGDVLDTNTLDCFGNAIRKPGDTLAMVKGDNPLTGPFYIEGAEPGDTLAVKILDLQVDSDQGIGAFAPGFGAINATNYTPMLAPPLPEKIWFYPIDRAVLQDGKAAAAEFQKFIDYPGLVGNFPWGALARLQLARSYAMTHDTTKAKAKYQDFFTLWKDADTDVPIYKEAKAEYAKLQ